MKDLNNPHWEVAQLGWAKGMSIRALIESALCTDGGHHKQFMLWLIAAKLGICFDDGFIAEYDPEEGIAP